MSMNCRYGLWQENPNHPSLHSVALRAAKIALPSGSAITIVRSVNRVQEPSRGCGLARIRTATNLCIQSSDVSGWISMDSYHFPTITDL